MFDDSNKVGADVVLLHGCPQSCMPNPVEACWRHFSQRICRLKIYSVVLFPALKPACSSAMIFSACGLKSIQFDLQHDFAWVADEANRSIVLALLQVAFLEKYNDHGVGLSPVCQILLQIVARAVITSSTPAWISYAVILSTPADFPFFNDCTATSTSLLRIGW